MPNVGDTAPGKEIGKSGNRYLWVQCPDCRQERWIQHNVSNAVTVRRCKNCHIKYVRDLSQPHS